jgi:hypothetical protein
MVRFSPQRSNTLDCKCRRGVSFPLGFVAGFAYLGDRANLPAGSGLAYQILSIN